MPSPSFADPPATDERVLTVSQLTGQLKGVVQARFSSVWVSGEISNFSRPQSGHCYFALKDPTAQISAVLWRGSAARLKFDLADGMEVVCRGHLDVYPPRGSYQLIVDELQPLGVGALELALRKLREKLAQEGLFDADRKRPLPQFPRRIGLVTSPTGAAILDFLQVLLRRWRGVEVFIFPARVQGEGAAGEIAAGIRAANQLNPPLDVLVVGRGGGSLEDLWCFNDEVVVRALAASRIPTVSAVGHEIDVTLADLAADVRALTPTEAAERVVPSAADVVQVMRSLEARIVRALATQLESRRQRLQSLASRPVLARPADGVRHLSRQIDELANRLQTALRSNLRDRQGRLATITGKLDSLSPLAVLGRGYSLTQDPSSQHLLTSVSQVKMGQSIVTRLVDGTVTSTVDSLQNHPPREGAAPQ